MFSVFTATYQRAATLHRPYESLRQQTCRDFEWIVVDDGSADGSIPLLSRWREEAGFPIRILQQLHAGKHVAWNRAVREARGELFLPLDSDDGCVPEALERLKQHWESIPADRRRGFSAVTVLCQDQHGALVGRPFPEEVLDSDSLEMYFRRRLVGEKWGFQRTDVLRCHPFPEPEGTTFVPESVVWFAIARDYKTRFVNERLRIYFRADAPAGPKLTGLSPSTARGRALFHETLLNEYLDHAVRSPTRLAASLVNHARYSLLSGTGSAAARRRLRSRGCRVLHFLLTPVAWALHLRDARRRGDH